jgi:uncharacterized protein (DUF58 family)
MLQASRERWRLEARRRWGAWIERRIPRAPEVVLGQRNVFVFPSRAGLVFLILLILLLLTAINYENNLVFGLTFLLGGLFVIAILHTYANLAGLSLRGSAVRAIFAGEQAGFSVVLRDLTGRAHDGLELRLPTSDFCTARVAADREDAKTLYVAAAHRGLLRPGRLLLETRFPLGLVRAWSWIDIDLRCIVYPRPAAFGEIPLAQGRGDQGHATSEAGLEDFSGFRDYRPGDPLRHVAWKTLAKGQPLQTREYVAYADRSLWLDWEQTGAAGGTEERLSLLSRWVLELHRLRAAYGLILPGFRLEPEAGDAQRERALTALALHGVEMAERT